MKNLIATVAVVALAFGAATAQNNSITLRTGANTSTLVAPNSGGAHTFTLPASGGTLLTTPAGVTGVVNYGTTTAQNTAVSNGSHWLFWLEYDGAATGAARGGRIISSSVGSTDGSAIGLDVTSLSTGSGTSVGIGVNAGGGTGSRTAISAIASNSGSGVNRGITISAANSSTTNEGLNIGVTGVGGSTNTGLHISVSGGTTNRAIDVVGGTIRLAASTLPLATLNADAEMVFWNDATDQLERLDSRPILYGIGATPQNTLEADGTNRLFNVAYSGTATGHAQGAVIASNASTFVTGNATGLTVTATSEATGNATGISVSASGATNTANNVAIDVTAGTVRLSGTSRSVYTPPAVINVGNGDAVPPSATYLELQMNDPGAAALTASLAAGVAGQVIYLRVGKPNYVGSTGIITFNVGDTPVINAAGNAAVNAQVVHAIYTNGKWEVLSNVTAVP